MFKVASLLLLAMSLAIAHAAAPTAATSVTADQLDKLLAGLHNTNDKSVARGLAGMKLTERVSADRLARWEAECHGERTREVLIALADAAAFLPPPATEIPATAAPDSATQDQILARTIEYVQETLPRLPNFLALRMTTAFEVTTEETLLSQQNTGQLFQPKPGKHFTNQALGPAKASGLPDAQLFWTGLIAQTISYRNGKEELEAAPSGSGPPGNSFFSLTTTGEFGPVLQVVLTEAPRDKIVWDHWEQHAAGTLAVFRYAVPRDRSHFGVAYTADQVPEFPAYHGEIAVDPASGTVIRITQLALVHDQFANHAVAILVEFGPAQIGGITYTVPIHGVATGNSFDAFANEDAQPAPVPFQTSINDITFTNYHVFRSRSRVLTGAGP
jgi:hypothetical protein